MCKMCSYCGGRWKFRLRCWKVVLVTGMVDILLLELEVFMVRYLDDESEVKLVIGMVEVLIKVSKVSLTYSITNCTPALYITPQACTRYTTFTSTLTIIPHRLCTLHMFCYTATQLILLYAIVRPRYRNASNGDRASTLI